MSKPPYPNNLKIFRLKHGFTQEEVIVELGHKTASRLSAWEQGNAVPSLGHLFTLAHLYKVRVEELYGPYKRKLGYARKRRKRKEIETLFTPLPNNQEEKSIEELVDEFAKILVDAYFYEKRQKKNQG